MTATLISAALAFGLVTPALAMHYQNHPQNELLRKSQMKEIQPLSDSAKSVGSDVSDETQAPLNADGKPEYVSLLPEIPEYASDEVIVRYKSDAASSRMSAVSAQITGSSSLLIPNTELLQLADGTDIHNVINELLKNPDVLYAEPNYMVPNAINAQSFSKGEEAVQALEQAAGTAETTAQTDSAAIELPNDPLFNDQWGLHNTGQWVKDGTVPGGTPDADMDLPEAWEITKGNEDVTIAIIGSGAKIDIPDLEGQIWENKGETPNNGKDDDKNGFDDDFNGWDFANRDNSLFDRSDSYSDAFGTVAAGQIAAKWGNNEGIAGVAPNVKVMPLKVLTKKGGRYTDIVEAIDYAEQNGVKIAMFGMVYEYRSRYIEDAINASSMLFVAPSGDRANRDILNLEIKPIYPASYPSPNILAVNGISISGVLSDLSAIGKESIDVSAPSELIASTDLNIDFGYAAQINNPGKYKAYFSSIGFEEIPIPDDQAVINTQRQDVFNRVMNYLKDGMKDTDGNAVPKALLVDDSVRGNAGGISRDPGIGIPGGPAIFPVYEELLNNASYDFDTVTTENIAADGPSLTTLEDYDIVIWFTGNAGDADTELLINAKDQKNLTDYLNNGGHLLLAGQNALDSIQDSNFALDVLGVQHAAEGGWITKAWGAKDSIFDGQTYLLPDFSLFINTITSSKPEMTTINMKNTSGAYTYATGTIFAAAYAAGVAGLIQSEYPDMSNTEIKQRIMTSGKSEKELKRYTASGKYISAYRALWNKDIPGMSLIDPSISNKLDNEKDPNHVYSIELYAGEEATISLTGVKGTDFDLILYDSSATTVASKDGAIAYSETPGTSNESITFRATNSGKYYINVFAVAGAGQYSLRVDYSNTTAVIEDNDPSLRYEGDWQTVSGSGYSNGSMKQLTGRGSVKFGFRGNAFEMIATTNDLQGHAKVFIDGLQVSGLNLFSATPKTQQVLYKTVLANGHHEVEISNVEPEFGEENIGFNVDAFKISNLISPIARSSTQVGPWVVRYDAKFADGSQLYTTTPGSSSEYTFNGTKVTLWSSLGNNRGKVNVFIDGVSVTSRPIDLYSNKRQDQVAVFTSEELKAGEHKIKIVHAGDTNPRSSNHIVTIEGLEVENLK